MRMLRTGIIITTLLMLLGAGQSLAANTADMDALIAAAKKEGTLTVYSNSSRHGKAGEAFEKQYGIKVYATQLKDVEIIEKIAKEAASDIKGADLVFVQDSGRVYGELIEPGYLVNYVPPVLQERLAAEDTQPLVFLFSHKAIVFNDEHGSDSPITNLWQLAEPEWKGRFQMKDPFQEGVNMNFLTMLTRPDISDKLAAAYKAMHGKDIELTTPNAGYEWIKRVFANGLVLGTSDTRVSEAVGARGQSRQLAGLFILNKLRVSDKKNLALSPATSVTPFSGFYYPMYCLVPSNARNENAARLFAHFMLTQAGFEPWVNSPGDYSPNPDIVTNQDDMTMQEWAAIQVREDPKWCFEHRAEVEDFLNSIL